MKNLDVKLTKMLTKKRCVKLINELITPNESGIIENVTLKEKLEFCGFSQFSLKDCVKFATENDSNIVVIGETETIDENGNVVNVAKIRKAFNAGTVDKPEFRFTADSLILSFNYRFAAKIKEYEDKKKAEAKAANKKSKLETKKEETAEEKQQRIAKDLAKEHKKQQRDEFKNKILSAKDLTELKQIQTELESLKLQSPDLYAVIKSMRIKLQPVTLFTDLDSIGTAQQRNVASK